MKKHMGQWDGFFTEFFDGEPDMVIAKWIWAVGVVLMLIAGVIVFGFVRGELW